MGGGREWFATFSSKFKGENVSKAVLVSSVTPFRLKQKIKSGGKSEEENETIKAINNE
jgi:hypothetical protein